MKHEQGQVYDILSINFLPVNFVVFTPQRKTHRQPLTSTFYQKTDYRKGLFNYSKRLLCANLRTYLFERTMDRSGMINLIS
jgi:hypothetical protein